MKVWHSIRANVHAYICMHACSMHTCIICRFERIRVVLPPCTPCACPPSSWLPLTRNMREVIRLDQMLPSKPACMQEIMVVNRDFSLSGNMKGKIARHATCLRFVLSLLVSTVAHGFLGPLACKQGSISTWKGDAFSLCRSLSWLDCCVTSTLLTHTYMHVCVCVCVWHTHRERERERLTYVYMYV